MIVRLYKLYFNRVNERFHERIQGLLVEALFSGFELDSVELNKLIDKMEKSFSGNPYLTKLFINQLIDLSKSLDGESKRVLSYVFLKCHLLSFAEEKLKKGSWVEKAMTIQYLSQLKIRPAFEYVKKFTDYRENELIRHEAQVAAVRLGGKDCLDFINDLESNLSVWQQLRIIEELKKLDFPIIPDYKKWLNSSNHSVVSFALKLVAIFGHYEALVHFKDVFAKNDITLKKELLKSIKKLQIPFNNEDIVRLLDVDELRIPAINTLSVTCDIEQEVIKPFLETEDYGLFMAVAMFFKRNDPPVLEEVRGTRNLSEMKVAVLQHVNDQRI